MSQSNEFSKDELQLMGVMIKDFTEILDKVPISDDPGEGYRLICIIKAFEIAFQQKYGTSTLDIVKKHLGIDWAGINFLNPNS